MEEGISSEIQLLGTDGNHYYAAPRATDVSGPSTPWQSTEDPWWDIRNGGGAFQSEWLTYIADDGRVWHAKLHCNFVQFENMAGYIAVYFEHEIQVNGADNHNEEFMFFKDWEGRNWRAQCLPVDRPFPARPQFRLSRI